MLAKNITSPRLHFDFFALFSSSDDSSGSSSLILITDEELAGDEDIETIAVVRRSIVHNAGRKATADEIIRSAQEFLESGESPIFVKEDAVIPRTSPKKKTASKGSSDSGDASVATAGENSDPSDQKCSGVPETEHVAERPGEDSLPLSENETQSKSQSTTSEPTADPRRDLGASPALPSVAMDDGKVFKQVRVTTHWPHHHHKSDHPTEGGGDSSPFHSQKHRKESNYKRRPSPMRTGYLRYGENLDVNFPH